MERMEDKEVIAIQYRKISELEEENKKLKEFKTKREESMFYFKAQMERAEPKTAKEAEDLQRAKELFEGIYRGELYYLEKENKNLKECNLNLQEWIDNKEKVNKSLREELEELKSTYVYDAKQVRDIC
jgi:hypothetical protein